MTKRFLPIWILITFLLAAVPSTHAGAYLRADTASGYTVSGWVNSNGQAYLDPIWSQAQHLDDSINPPTGSAYCLDGKDLQSNLLGSRCFDITFPPHDPNGEALVERFYLVLNLPSPAVSISLREGDEVLAERRASSNAPTISLTAPSAPLPAAGAVELTWQAGDVDADALRYRVSYNAGGGWLLLDSDLSEPALTVDLDNLPGSEAAMLLVEVTDGFLNARVLSPPFQVNNKPPQIHITTPRSGAILSEDKIIRLDAQVGDLEEGELSKGQMRWSSNLQGELGQGPTLDVKLVTGEHTLTLSASDRSGRSASASVQVTVGVPKPPLIGDGGLFSTQNLLVGGAVLMALVLVLGGISWYYESRKPQKPARRKSHASQAHKPAQPISQPAAATPAKVNTAPLPQVAAFTIPLPADAKPAQPVVQPPVPSADEETYQKALEDIKAGRYEPGAKALARYLQAHPDRRDGWMWLGYAALKLKHVDTARTCFQRARSLGHPGAEKALHDLYDEKM